MNRSFATRVVLGWVSLYTRGLPAEARLARRDEIESDLWSQREEARSICRSGLSLAVEILARLILGIAADVSWRLERGQEPDKRIERTADKATRFVALTAIVGGIAWAAGVVDWMVTAATDPGVKIWEMPLLAALGMIALVALSLSLGGLGYLLLSRLEASVGLIALLGACCGVMTALGSPSLVVFLPVASVVTMLDLPRVHALGWLPALLHAASAPAILVGVAAYSDESLVGIAGLWFFIYCMSWVAIGLDLLAGFPRSSSDAHRAHVGGAAVHRSGLHHGYRA